MSKYELFESTANYAKHFADSNALYITVNSNNSMSADDLDKYIKRWFTSVEIAVFGEKKRKSNMRKHRVERLVAIHTQTTKAHAHILVNAKCCSPSALKRILKFAWLDMCDAHTESDFVFHCELLRDRESSGRYNNKELLSQHEHNSFNSCCISSTSDCSLFEPTAWDYGHLTASGSKLAARFILQEVDLTASQCSD